MAIGGCVLVLIVNGLIFREASKPRPMAVLKVLTVISLVWIFAGAWGMCTRKLWGRAFVLGILYVGCVAFLITITVSLTMTDSPLAGRLTPFVIGGVVYLFVSLVLTKSRNVRRLTSRTWD